jgi:glutaredoxin
LKKYLVIGVLVLMLLAPICGASTILSNSNENEKPRSSSYADFTHSVIVEVGTMTTCPYCVTTANQLWSIYNSGDFDFHYVSLVYDVANANVRNRLKDLGVSSVPDVFFDGGFRKLLGAQTNELPYRNAINQSGVRVVPDIDITVSVSWLGGGKLKLEIIVANNENETFNGQLRVYIVEKESRWNDNSGHPYHFAAIDIPIDRSLSVPRAQSLARGDTYKFSKLWLGSLYGFGDITQDNTLVIASVFDPASGYAVQTSAAEPTIVNGYVPLKSLILERLIDFFPILVRILKF